MREDGLRVWRGGSQSHALCKIRSVLLLGGCSEAGTWRAGGFLYSREGWKGIGMTGVRGDINPAGAGLGNVRAQLRLYWRNNFFHSPLSERDLPESRKLAEQREANVLSPGYSFSVCIRLPENSPSTMQRELRPVLRKCCGPKSQQV